MRLLHTSDWHLGRALCGRKRDGEFHAFLRWLVDAVEREGIDAVVVAGDVFDTGTPPNWAQEMYYNFLRDIAKSSCRHIVVTAGNHDSPSFLAAPGGLLRALDIHVVGAAGDAPEDEVIVLRGRDGKAELIVGAVPYLRDRDVRESAAGESAEEKDGKLLDGLRDHYRRVSEAAERARADSGGGVPVVLTGHLFAAGGVVEDNDGVRELHVGTLARTPADVFPETADYVALGHLHLPQKVAGRETVRYSGAPLAMHFGGSRDNRSVTIVDFSGDGAAVRVVPVPAFRRLELVSGDWSAIEKRLADLAAGTASEESTDASEDNAVWLEIVHDGADIIPDLRDRVAAAVAGTRLQAVSFKNHRLSGNILTQAVAGETLDDLSPDDVFERRLDADAVPEDQRPALRAAHAEVLLALHDEDVGQE